MDDGNKRVREEEMSSPSKRTAYPDTDDFPWRQFTRHQLDADYNKFCRRMLQEAPVFPIGMCFAGYACTDHSFQRERLAVSSHGQRTALDLWRDDKAMVLDYYEREGNSDLFASIRFLSKGPAHFPPNVAAMMFKRLGSKRVFDPYAGWGNRCLAAMALGIDYLGVDSNPALVPCYQELISAFPHDGNVRFVPGRAEDVDIGDYKPDLVFTSPPFWTKTNQLLEAYPACEPDMDRFLRTSLFPMMRKMLPMAPVVLYINESLYKRVVGEFGTPKIFKFKRQVTRKDPYGDHLFYWEAKPVIARGPRKSHCCSGCGTTSPEMFEVKKRSMCRKCKNHLDKNRAVQEKTAKQGAVLVNSVTSREQACELVFTWRKNNGCGSRWAGTAEVYDLYKTLKKIEAAPALQVTLPGPKKNDGGELKLDFLTHSVKQETIDWFKKVNKLYHGLKS